MNNFYLDCMGMVWDNIIALQSQLSEEGIGSNISTGSLCIHTTPEVFIEKHPELKHLVLKHNEQSSLASLQEVLREEKRNNATQTT